MLAKIKVLLYFQGVPACGKGKNMCGIIGVIGTPFASQEAYQGLLLMQHRGQDAAGILSFDFQNQRYELHKKQGLVDKVFEKSDLEKLNGQMALGHTRYSTVGSNDARDIQPIILSYPYGLGLVHNGNLVNFYELIEYLNTTKDRYVFSRNDAEALLNIMAEGLNHYKSGRSREFDFESLKFACSKIFEQAMGGYSVIGTLAGKGMYAFRDPNGIRPLILGRRNISEREKELYPDCSHSAYCMASESNTLQYLGYDIVRDVEPGELIYISHNGNFYSEKLIENNLKKPCMFEWIYFANPETILEQKNVYSTRINMGIELARRTQKHIESGAIQPDLVVPVPETSRVSAIAMAEELGIPYREVLIKNRYIQRSFILDTQDKRERAVRLKLTPVISEIRGKKILLVDDSIVRGTTSKRIIKMLRDAGAKEVYMASTCPPIYHPCFYGIDFPSHEELVANGRTSAEIKKEIEADRMIYMDIEGLKKSIGLKDMCLACLDGKYPVDISSAGNFKSNRNNDRMEPTENSIH